MKKVLTSVILLAILAVQIWEVNLLVKSENELEDARGEIKTLTQQSVSLKSKLEESNRDFDMLKATNERELGELTKKADELKAENDKLSGENSKLRAENQELKK